MWEIVPSLICLTFIEYFPKISCHVHDPVKKMRKRRLQKAKDLPKVAE